jgi:hypothetical protein
MAIYDDQEESGNPLVPGDNSTPGQHDDLGVHPERREAENEDWENRFNEPSHESEDGDGGHGPGLSDLAHSEGHPPSNPNADKSEKSKRPGGLKTAEGAAGADQVGNGFDEGGDTRTGRQRFLAGALHGAGAARNQGPKPKGKGKKKLLIAGAFAGAGIAAGIVILIIVIGALLIPQLAQHITEYEFARVTREYAANAEEVTDEKLAIDAIPDETENSVKDGLFASVKDKIDSVGARTSTLFSALDDYRPSKVIENLGSDNKGLILTYGKTTLTGRQVLTGVTLDGAEYEVQQQGYTRFIPALSQIVQFKNDISFSQNFAPAVGTALRTDEIGPIVRSATAKEIRERLDIGLIAWTIGKYTGKNAEQARIQQGQDLDTDVGGQGTPSTAVTPPVANTENAIASEEAAAATDPTQIGEAIANDGILPSVKATISTALQKSGIADVVGFINPLYAISLPVCIVFDGSMEQSGSSIDNQTTQQQRAYYYIAAAADQEKAGDTTAEAVGALNNDLNADGNISNSNPELRSAGVTVNTVQTPSAEASAGGEYTLLNATPGVPADFASVVNSMGGTACKVLTNLGLGIIIGAGNLALGFFTGGTSTEAEAAVGTAAAEVTEEAADNVAEAAAGSAAESAGTSAISSFITKTGVVTRKIGNLLWPTAKSAAKLSAVTIAAKLVVLARSGELYNGLTQGNDLADEADSGGNIAAGEIARQELYGRPLTQTEVAQSNIDDQNSISYENSQKDAYQRYFALDNADSLLSKVGSDLYGMVYGKPFIASLGSLITKTLNPLKLITGIFGSANDKVAAASVTDTSDYGNIQFGYSDAEETLIHSDTSYLPIPNQEALDQAPAIGVGDPNGCSPGQDAEDCIDATYSVCFTDTIGTLLSLGGIVRDSQGNVVANQGLCSPQNLGIDNPTYGKLVFRWRLAHAYNNVISDLNQEGQLN